MTSASDTGRMCVLLQPCSSAFAARGAGGVADVFSVISQCIRGLLCCFLWRKDAVVAWIKARDGWGMGGWSMW